MKTFIVLLSFVICTCAFSWEVVKKKDEYFLVDKDKKSYAIISEGGDPSFVKTESFAPGLERIVYKAGVAGTSELKVIHRALLMKKDDKKVLGDFPVSYQNMDGQQKTDVKWSIQKDQVLIQDPETELTQKVQLR